MALEIFKLLGRVAVENSEANQEIDETTTKASQAHARMSSAFSGIGRAAVVGAKVVAGAFAAIGGTLIGLGTLAVRYNSEMEQYQTSFEVMLGSQEEALALTERLRETAASTPFEMSDLASVTQLLLNYGFTADDATGSMMMLGDIAQGNADKMTRIATAYGQMSSAGKVTLEDIKQMIEAGFNPLQEISDTTGESMSSLYQRISDGKISVDEITASMQRSTAEGGRYFQSMEKQSQTLQGRMSTLKDTVSEALGQAFSSVSETLANNVIPRLTEMAEKYIPKIGEVVDALLPSLLNIAESILPGVLILIETLVPLFVQFTETVAPILAEIFAQIAPHLMTIVQQLLPPLMNILVMTLPLLGQLAESVLPVVVQLLDMLMPVLSLLVQKLLPPLMRLLQPILDLLSPFIMLLQPILDLLVMILNPIVRLIDNLLVPLISLISELAEGALANLVDWLQVAAQFLSTHFSVAVNHIMICLETLKGVFRGIIDFVKAVFTGDWAAAWQAVKDIFSSITTGISSAFKNVINGVIRAINVFIRGINNIKIPDWVPGVGGRGFNIRQIPLLAKGGVLEKGQVGLLEGTGAEAVVPLEQNRAWISRVAEDMNVALGGNNQDIKELKELFRDFVEVLPEMMSDAFATMKFDVNNREFARLVKAVN